MTHHAVSRDFQLDNDVAVVSIEGDVDEPPADRELNAGYPFFVVESQARFDQAEVPDEVVPQISLEGELPRGLPSRSSSGSTSPVTFSVSPAGCSSMSSL